MREVIFYTFSTIPQVLAGAIALIGVFAILKIKGFQDTLSGIAQNFYDEIKKNMVDMGRGTPNVIDMVVFNSKMQGFKKSKISLDYVSIKTEMDNFMNKEKQVIHERQSMKTNLEQLILVYGSILEKIEFLKSRTKRNIIFAIIIIVTSITIIALTDSIPKWFAIALLATFILLVLIYLLSLVQIIKKSFDTPPPIITE